jgi:hypothetical protein
MPDEETLTAGALLERVTADEPPMGLSPVAVRRAARTGLQRRRRRMAGASAAAAAVLAVGGIAVGVQVATGNDRGSGPTVSRPTTFSPDALVRSIQQSVSTAQAASTASPDTTWTLESVLTPGGPSSTPLTGADRAQADSWQARFTDGDEHVLDVILVHEGDTSFDIATHGCSVDLATHFSDVCRVSRKDGEPTTSTQSTRYVERDAYQMRDRGWPTPHDDLLVQPIPQDKYWYIQELTEHSDSGLTVAVIEAVRSAEGPAAASEFTLTEQQLTQISTDPALTFPDHTGEQDQAAKALRRLEDKARHRNDVVRAGEARAAVERIRDYLADWAANGLAHAGRYLVADQRAPAGTTEPDLASGVVDSYSLRSWRSPTDFTLQVSLDLHFNGSPMTLDEGRNDLFFTVHPGGAGGTYLLQVASGP